MKYPLSSLVHYPKCEMLRRLSAFYCDLALKPAKNLNRVMFFGTEDFALESLKVLTRKKKMGEIKELEVVTVRQSQVKLPVWKFCNKNGIKCHEWPICLPNGKFDLGIVVSFGHLIPKNVISAFPLGILNVHGSLLPRWRGGAPITHAILNGDKTTGITIMKIEPYQFDTGRMLYQKCIDIPSEMHCNELTSEMSILGAQCLEHCIADLPYFSKNSILQPKKGVTKAPIMTNKQSRIIWEEMEVDLIKRMYYALSSRHPLWTTWNNVRLSLHNLVRIELDPEHTSISSSFNTTYDFIKLLEQKSRISNDIIEQKLHKIDKVNLISNKIPGQVEYGRKSQLLRISCKNGIVMFKDVSIQNRKKMSANDFQNGFLSKVPVHKRYFY